MTERKKKSDGKKVREKTQGKHEEIKARKRHEKLYEVMRREIQTQRLRATKDHSYEGTERLRPGSALQMSTVIAVNQYKGLTLFSVAVNVLLHTGNNLISPLISACARSKAITPYNLDRCEHPSVNWETSHGLKKLTKSQTKFVSIWSVGSLTNWAFQTNVSKFWLFFCLFTVEYPVCIVCVCVSIYIIYIFVCVCVCQAVHKSCSGILWSLISYEVTETCQASSWL